MTEDDDVPIVEIGLRRDGDDCFVQARRPGAKQHIEYGPMAEAATRPFIEGLKRAVASLGIAGLAHEKATWDLAMTPPSERKAFNPEEEKKWLRRKK